MKKIVFLLCLFVSINAFSQSVPVSLEFTTVTVPEPLSFDKAKIQIGKPYTENGVRLVKVYIQQTKEVTPNDVITRTRNLVVPATFLTVLAFDTNEMKVTVNKQQLNLLLLPYNIQVQ